MILFLLQGLGDSLERDNLPQGYDEDPLYVPTDVSGIGVVPPSPLYSSGGPSTPVPAVGIGNNGSGGGGGGGSRASISSTSSREFQLSSSGKDFFNSVTSEIENLTAQTSSMFSDFFGSGEKCFSIRKSITQIRYMIFLGVVKRL